MPERTVFLTRKDGKTAEQVATDKRLAREKKIAKKAGQKARAEAIPELEVLADDVKAAHGAASAPINIEQLHYLGSRGLSQQAASSLIVEGFLMDAFRDIKNEKVTTALRTRLLVHLECLIKG